jgi:hypothetical protein
MKPVTFTLCMLFFFTFGAYAQNDAISGCNDPNGGIQIIFDLEENCPTAPGSLAGKERIGFHSGYNQWQGVIAYDNANAVNGVNNSQDTFIVYIPDVDAYYSQSSGTVTRIDFVFNQGLTDPNEPWASEGKDKDNNNDGNCDDFFLLLSSVTETCAFTASSRRPFLDLSFRVSPNPLRDRGFVTFSNPNNETYDVRLVNIHGQTLRVYRQINGDILEIERGNLPAGMYIVNFYSAAGKVGATRLVIE